jgi:hypothetical protein
MCSFPNEFTVLFDWPTINYPDQDIFIFIIYTLETSPTPTQK